MDIGICVHAIESRKLGHLWLMATVLSLSHQLVEAQHLFLSPTQS